MNEQEYIEKRLDDQQQWYEKKSAWNQTWFKRLRLVEIVLAAGVPFASSLMDKNPEVIPMVVSAMAFLIAAISAVISLSNFQDSWLQYRTAAEQLKREKFLFLTGSEPYNGDDPFHDLVQNVEKILGEENSSWREQNKSANSEDLAQQIGQRIKEIVAEQSSSTVAGMENAATGEMGEGESALPEDSSEPSPPSVDSPSSS